MIRSPGAQSETFNSCREAVGSQNRILFLSLKGLHPKSYLLSPAILIVFLAHRHALYPTPFLLCLRRCPLVCLSCDAGALTNLVFLALLLNGTKAPGNGSLLLFPVLSSPVEILTLKSLVTLLLTGPAYRRQLNPL